MAGAAPFAMAGASLLSGVMQGAGAAAQGNAAMAAAAENARIQSENAARLAEAAKLEEQQGVTAAARVRRKGRALRGNTLAALAGAGIDVGDGSPIELLSAQAKETEFQAEQAKWERDYRAWQMRVQAHDTTNRALITLRTGQQQRDASYLAAVGAEVGGLTRAGASAFDLFSRGGSDDSGPPGGEP